MKISTLIKTTTAAILLSTSLAYAQIPAAFANDPAVLKIAEQLTAQGFEIVSVKVTLLGRYKIEAVAAGYDREIILSPGAGTVLRDEWNATDTGTGDTGTGTDATGVDVVGTDGTGIDDSGSNDSGSNDSGSSDNGSNDSGASNNGSSDNGAPEGPETGGPETDGPETN